VRLSISLPDGDVAALDEYARASGLDRSAVIRRALRLLLRPQLEQHYAAAWEEWKVSGEEAAWEGTAADGLSDAPR
jgi:Arc/MetJ-type ribon-helix-helix transcriptional regulator